MVYYIRFLKTPRLQKQKTGAQSISALICIATDLGDAFLAQDVDLLVTLGLDQSEKILYQEPLRWSAGKRELPITLGPFPPHVSAQPIVLSVAATDGNRKRSRTSFADRQLLGQPDVPLVVSGWSAPFGGPEGLVAEKLVERRLELPGNLDLRIWEETGNSIARHIWDAALASVIYLQQIATGASSTPILQNLLQSQRNRPLNVIELGSGCGIVGIALAEMLPNSSVLLTDLPEVEEIVTQNIAVAKPTEASKLEFRTLDWDGALPENLCSGSIDLILVSDCTYNADSLPALVSVLSRLVQMSPEAIILVALKRRHDSETIFFDLMREAGLSNLHQDNLQIPSEHDQVDQIELYSYGINKDAQHS
ncbi:putative methyltransferase-domain-containing protein [Aspergillus avenaceus]|uniref:Putative methyltransferase-domain-containing protein n=1 Tax=Aspergillus avenaceus TaxID=36643 RepID=A0A5N6TMW9_ASPAV|nr:putative methyltransferase-domain-containing protein [Aspergillus avenaceus]